MRHFSLWLLLAFGAMAQAQSSFRTQGQLFGVMACSTGGPNSTFTVGAADGARVLSRPIPFYLTAPNGVISHVDHLRLEITPTKVDDDSLMILLLGWSNNCSSRVYVDTIYVGLVANQTSYADFSPSIFGEDYLFPYEGRFSIANADSGNTGQFPYFGEVADTNVWKGRLLLWLY